MISATVEFDLIRLTAQSSGPNPKEPGGGSPEYTRSEIMAIAGEVPRTAFHALIAQVCGDDASINYLLDWLHSKSLAEWFTNPEHATKKLTAMELRKLAEIALIAWLHPRSPQATNYETRGAYMGCSQDRFKRVFQAHYNWMLGELGHQETIGNKAYKNRKFGPD